jgi:2-dehydro-3-deoxygalactonokinase
MASYITIDGGTTNTRLSLVADGKIIQTLKYNVGARIGIENKDILISSVREGIKSLLDQRADSSDSLKAIICSGMLTSEFGIFNLPHILAPAGLSELHFGMKTLSVFEVSPLPITFIPGVRISGSDLASVDMMRGEESEIMGLVMAEREKVTYVLPGSHSKIINVDEAGRITDFTTMLTGEMIYALSGYTILKDAVKLDGAEIDSESLIFGYEYSKKHGINEALFKARVMKNLFSKTPDEVYSFFMGAVLCAEVDAILSFGSSKIIIGGRRQIKEALYILLKSINTGAVINTVSDEDVACANVFGMIKIFEYNS